MMAETNTAATTDKETSPEETPESLQSKVEDDKWLIRDSDVYYEEYKECTSFRARFQQYFVYGETLDCNQWKKDYDNCCKWESSKDLKAAHAVITSEQKRRMERFRAHYRNDTWKKRDSPPADWDKPLPDWMLKRNENTFLAQKAKELKEGIEEETKKSCSIM